MRTVVLSLAVTTIVGLPVETTNCHVDTCDASARSQFAGLYKCGDRIAWLKSYAGYSEWDACHTVAVDEFPEECGACAPPAGEDEHPTRCGQKQCNVDVLSKDAGGYTCGARVSWLRVWAGHSEADACKKVVDEFPDECGKCDPTAVPETTVSSMIKITPPAWQAAGKYMGSSVAISGQHVVMGGNGAYLFDTEGKQLALLSTRDDHDGAFGRDVAISGERIVVSSYYNDAHGQNSGSAYVFDLKGAQIAKLTPSDAFPKQNFGSNVAIYGERIVVGAFARYAWGRTAPGSAYIFSTAGEQIAKLVAPDGEDKDQFGSGVAIGADRIVVGASADQDHGWSSGSAYLFDVTGKFLAKLTSDDASIGDLFGDRVAMCGDRIVVTARHKNYQRGSAYIFDKDGKQLHKLVAADAAQSDYLGRGVSCSGERIIVGAHGDDDHGSMSGSAYVFDMEGNQLAKITAPSAAKGDWFGMSVAIDGNQIVVGASGDDDHGKYSGAAYIGTLNN